MKEYGISGDWATLREMRHIGIKCLEVYIGHREEKFVLIAINEAMTEYITTIIDNKQNTHNPPMSDVTMWEMIMTEAKHHTAWELVKKINHSHGSLCEHGSDFTEIVYNALGHIETSFKGIFFGDIVKHVPTGETHIVCKVNDDDKHIWVKSESEGKIEISDCVLIERGTYDSRQKLLSELYERPRTDPRRCLQDCFLE